MIHIVHLFLLCFLIVGIICSIIVSFDIYNNLRLRFQRFHIGRWDSEKNWKDAVENTTARWLKRTPIVPKLTTNRLYLIDIIRGNHRSHTIQYWQIAGLLIGEGYSENSKQKIEKLIDPKSKCWSFEINHIEIGLLGYAVLLNFDSVVYKPAMDQIYGFILNQKDSLLGTIPYRKDSCFLRYVDTLGFICPFLSLYGDKYQLTESFDLAEKCFTEYSSYLSPFGFPPHAYNLELSLPLGVYDWGRGLGWYILALINLYDYSYESEKKESYKEQIVSLSNSIIFCQNKAGGFSASLFMPSRPTEGSASVLCSLLLLKAYEITGNDLYHESLLRTLIAMRKLTRRDGALDMCQGDTKGIGNYSTDYSIMPFAQGLLLYVLKQIIPS